jgi:hypothetical protein
MLTEWTEKESTAQVRPQVPFVSDEPTVKRDVPPNFGSLFWKYRARPGLRRSSFRVRRLLGQPRGPLAHEQPCDRWDNAGRTRPSQNRRRPRHRRPDLRQSKKSDAVTKESETCRAIHKEFLAVATLTLTRSKSPLEPSKSLAFSRKKVTE